MASSAPDKLFPGQSGFPTPNEAPDEETCRVFSIPADEEYLALIMGALDALRQPYNWYINGTMSQEEAATAFGEIIDKAYETALTGQCTPDVEAPYWDDDANSDDSAPVTEQPWYGRVLDPIAPPGELDFVEDIALWTFTGFVAFGFGLDAAIYFKTHIGRFYITLRDTNIVQLIRIVVDSIDIGTITLPGTSSGEVDVPVYADPAVTTGHDIYVMRVS